MSDRSESSSDDGAYQYVDFDSEARASESKAALTSSDDDDDETVTTRAGTQLRRRNRLVSYGAATQGKNYIVKEGWLVKTGRKLRARKRRWFTLSSTATLYAHKKKGAKRVLSEFDLHANGVFVDDIEITKAGVVVYVDEKDCSFRLQTPRRSYTLYGGNVDDAMAWVRAINRVAPNIKYDAATEKRLHAHVRADSGGVGDGIPSSDED